jgi:DNA-binding transcriptional regulator YiaG
MIKSMRSRLGVSQANLAILLDAAPQSVYNWEKKEGRLSFRGDTKARIVALRKLTKAEVEKRLEKI